jgi:hypothetical protein
MVTEPVRDEPPQPTGVVDQVEFSRHCAALWSWAGEPTEDTLRQAAGPRHTPSGFVAESLPAGTSQRVLAGDPSWDDVEAFVTACLRYGGLSAEQAAARLVDWRQAWRTLDATATIAAPPDGAQRPAADRLPDARKRRRIPVAAAAAAVAAVLVAVVGVTALSRADDSGGDQPGGDSTQPAPESLGSAPSIDPTEDSISALVASATAAPPTQSPATGRASQPAPKVTTPAAPAPPPSPGTRASPTTSAVRIANTVVNLNTAAGHGCTAWLNGATPGPWAMGVVQTSGDDCEMALYRSKDGGAHFYIVSGAHRISAGQDSTHLYWDGDVYLAHVCLHDYTTGQSACGGSYGPGLAGG